MNIIICAWCSHNGEYHHHPPTIYDICTQVSREKSMEVATIERIHHLPSNQLLPSAHTITCQISQICIFLVYFWFFYLSIFYFCFCILAHFNLLKSAAPIRMCVWNNSDFHVFEHVFFSSCIFCLYFVYVFCLWTRKSEKENDVNIVITGLSWTKWGGKNSCEVQIKFKTSLSSSLLPNHTELFTSHLFSKRRTYFKF